jgi:hypothetical protein
VKPGWAAPSVRARLLASRRLGAAGSRAVAAAGSPEGAVRMVAASPYGRDVHNAMGVLDAQRGARATTLWHLRVLAGWLPPGESDVVRVLAGGYEIANITSHVDELAGADPIAPFELGALTAAWPRTRGTRSMAELRAVLASTPWGDPGTSERASFAAAMRLAWARRVSERIPELRRWAATAAAVVIASERFGHGRELSSPAAIDARRLLGAGWAGASLGQLAAGLPADARWVFAGLDDEGSTWRAETAWRRGLRNAAARSVSRTGTGRADVAWSAVLLLTDVQQVCGALEAAAWGPNGLETFDAVA